MFYQRIWDKNRVCCICKWKSKGILNFNAYLFLWWWDLPAGLWRHYNLIVWMTLIIPRRCFPTIIKFAAVSDLKAIRHLALCLQISSHLKLILCQNLTLSDEYFIDSFCKIKLYSLFSNTISLFCEASILVSFWFYRKRCFQNIFVDQTFWINSPPVLSLTKYKS